MARRTKTPKPGRPVRPFPISIGKVHGRTLWNLDNYFWRYGAHEFTAVTDQSARQIAARLHEDHKTK